MRRPPAAPGSQRQPDAEQVRLPLGFRFALQRALSLRDSVLARAGFCTQQPFRADSADSGHGYGKYRTYNSQYNIAEVILSAFAGQVSEYECAAVPRSANVARIAALARLARDAMHASPSGGLRGRAGLRVHTPILTLVNSGWAILCFQLSS